MSCLSVGGGQCWPPLFLWGYMYKKRKELRRFSRAISKRISAKDITIRQFAEQHCAKYGLQWGTLNRYLYSTNAPSILMCWAIAESLSDLTKEPVDVVFMELAQAIRNKKTPD